MNAASVWLVFWLSLIGRGLLAQEPHNVYLFQEASTGYSVEAENMEQSSLIRLIRPNNEKETHPFEVSNGPIEALRFNASSPERLAVSQRNAINLFTLDPALRKKKSFLSPKQPIKKIRFSLNDNYFFWSTDRQINQYRFLQDQNSPILQSTRSQKIQDFAPLPQGRIAYVLNGSWDITVISQDQSDKFLLSHHNAPIMGLESDNSGNLYALDSNFRLSIWDVNKGRPERSIELNPNGKHTRLIGFSIDRKNNKLYILIYDNQPLGLSYKLADLQRNHVNVQKMDLQSSRFSEVAPIPASSFTGATHRSKDSPFFDHNVEYNYYKLAQIEAENKNWQKALSFLEKISLNSPNYRNAKFLEKKIYKRLNNQKKVEAAIQLLKEENQEQALFLIREVLKTEPENKEAQQYLKYIRKEGNFSLTWMLPVPVIFVLLILMFLLLKYKKSLKNKYQSLFSKKKEQQSDKKQKKEKPRPQTEPETQQEQTKKSKPSHETKNAQTARDKEKVGRVFKLTEVVLQNAISFDREKTYHSSWDALTKELSNIKFQSESLNIQADELLEHLHQMQTSIVTLVSSLSNSPLTPKSEDYYSLFDLGKNATSTEIKTAYKKKMKEYHPDRHNNSEYEWIRQISEEKTRLIQKAYETLSNPQKRKHYDKTL